jgi:hypothetical protein
MKDMLSAIQDWPTILQGAAGSALFALLLFIGQRIAGVLPQAFSRLSAKRRSSYLRSRLFRLRARKATDPAEKAALMSGLWYRASRDLIKAMIWLTLGLMFSGVVGVWSLVGYLGCVYHLFFALEVVKPVTDDLATIDQKIKEISEKLRSLPL